MAKAQHNKNKIKKVMIEAKRASCKNFAGEITYNTKTSTIWKNSKPQRKDLMKNTHICNI